MPSYKGYKARHENLETGYLCEDCSEHIRDINKLDKVSSGLYKDVYCTNCKENLMGGSSLKEEYTVSDHDIDKWIPTLNERLCCIIDILFEDMYPMIGLGPGEEKEEKKVSSNASFYSHPEDALEQVIIMLQSPEKEEQQRNKIEKFVDPLSKKGDLRYNYYPEYLQYTITVV